MLNPHVEGWLGFDWKLNQCSVAVALPQLVVLAEHWILGDRVHICWKNDKKFLNIETVHLKVNAHFYMYLPVHLSSGFTGVLKSS
jgi:hypothetical protein